MQVDYITFYGKPIDIRNPDVSMIDLRDIVKCLSGIRRGNGTLFTVLEHSVHCAIIAEYCGASNHVVVDCLVHDFHEAYTGDVITKCKSESFILIESQWERIVRPFFSGRGTRFSNVSAYDYVALYFEMEMCGHAGAETVGLGLTEKHYEIIHKVRSFPFVTESFMLTDEECVQYIVNKLGLHEQLPELLEAVK